MNKVHFIVAVFVFSGISTYPMEEKQVDRESYKFKDDDTLSNKGSLDSLKDSMGEDNSDDDSENSSQIKDLFDAIKCCNVDRVRECIESDKNAVKTRNRFGMLPLCHTLLMAGENLDNVASIVKLLLDNGASPNRGDQENDDTPLLDAIVLYNRLNNKSSDVKILEILLDAGADPDVSFRNGNHFLVALGNVIASEDQKDALINKVKPRCKNIELPSDDQTVKNDLDNVAQIPSVNLNTTVPIDE